DYIQELSSRHGHFLGQTTLPTRSLCPLLALQRLFKLFHPSLQNIDLSEALLSGIANLLNKLWNFQIQGRQMVYKTPKIKSHASYVSGLTWGGRIKRGSGGCLRHSSCSLGIIEYSPGIESNDPTGFPTRQHKLRCICKLSCRA